MKMMSDLKLILSWTICYLLTVNVIIAMTHPAVPVDKQDNYVSGDLEVTDDDGNIENAVINYLYAKQLANRLRNLDIRDLQRKRSYWKQCAFNAVSCFG